MVDERDEDLLPGYPGDPQAVGRISLPNVEGPVGGGRQIDGSSCPLGAPRPVACGPVG